MGPIFIQFFGRIVALLPEWLLRGGCVALGEIILTLIPRRRRVLFSNLDHAFPERARSWQVGIARQSCRRLVETGLLSLASPYLSERRIRTIAHLTPEALAIMGRWNSDPKATLVVAPHLAYWESLTWIGLFSPLPEFGTIFRPLRSPQMDAYVKRTRERFGIKLLSRKDGFQEALKILRRRGVVGVLFDQNAGETGALSTLFGRIASTTELPGLMAAKYDADIVAIFARRHAFWRIEINLQPVAHDRTVPGVTLALNRWLESRLAGDDNLCASWLWSHARWRTQTIPCRRLRLEAKRNLLPEDLAARGLAAVPRKDRIFVRLPNWLGDVVMALPLLRAIRVSRPDAELTLIGKAGFAPLMKLWAAGDRYEALPARGAGYFLHFWRLRRRHPDAYLLFTNSTRGDLEAWLTRCPQRFGILRPGKRRALLTDAFPVPEDFDEAQHHQIELWEKFLRHFGLIQPPVLEPAPRPDPAPLSPPQIGLICGSENTPAKRWPVARWRELIGELPAAHFTLLGTQADRAITDVIAAGFDPSRVRNLAGQTDLPAYIACLQSCHLLVTNDTGGMHLANALGVPVVVLFGPTNPVRTGPVFAAPRHPLQPPDCPPTGGGDLAAVQAQTVAATVRAALESSV